MRKKRQKQAKIPGAYTYQICVSGAAKGASVEEGKELAKAAGRAIASSGNMLLTGATIGLPNYAAVGAKEAGGWSVGISPAASKVEHTRKYRLPTACYDVVLYTGLHYVGRDTLLVASSDAVISIGGRLGTLHEFTVAMEMDKPIGFLQGAGGVSNEIMDILHAAGEAKSDLVLFDDDPGRLIRSVLAKLNELNHEYLDVYNDDVAPCVICIEGDGLCELHVHTGKKRPNTVIG